MEGLEDTDVEDVVDARALRKTKTIGDIADTFHHLKWPSVAQAELAGRSRH